MEKIERLTHAVIGPHSLERYGPLLGVFQFCLLFIGAVFWIDASSGAQNFSATTWGAMAYAIDAEFWAMANMGASAIALIGLINPIHRRMVTIGGSLHIAQNLAISYSAAFTGGDMAVALYASILLITINTLMVAGAVSEWKR